jgi:hypothetical protein
MRSTSSSEISSLVLSYSLVVRGDWCAAICCSIDEEDPNLTHVWLEMPRLPLAELRREVPKTIKRVLYQHARRHNYPTYWLAIYVNVSLAAYELPPDYVAKITAGALLTKPPSNNVERVWVWNPGLHLAFPG